MKININNKIYKVENKEFITDGIIGNITNFILGNEITGQITISSDKEFRKILLKKNLNNKDKIANLFHEISHGILLELQDKYDKIDCENEEQTNYLKRILLKIFKVKCQ